MRKKDYKDTIVFKLHQQGASAIVINDMVRWLDDNTPDYFDGVTACRCATANPIISE